MIFLTPRETYGHLDRYIKKTRKVHVICSEWEKQYFNRLKKIKLMQVTMPSAKLMVSVHWGWRLTREGRRYFVRRTPRSNSLDNIKIQKFLSVKLTKAFLRVWTKFKIGSDISDRVWFRKEVRHDCFKQKWGLRYGIRSHNNLWNRMFSAWKF